MILSDVFNSIPLYLGADGKKSLKKKAQLFNRIEFDNAFIQNCEKALNVRYKINNLPDSCDNRVVMQSLLYHGSVCFWEMNGEILALPALPDSGLTMYGYSKSCFVYGRNGFNRKVNLYIPGEETAPVLGDGFPTLPKGDGWGVYVRENRFNYPFLNYCISYADKIADSMRTLDVARKNIKVPYIVVAEEQIVNSVKQFFESRNDNMEYIVSSGIFPADKITLLPIQTTPENLKASCDLIEWYYNKFNELCFLFSNGNPDKKERLLVDEVNANSDSTDKMLIGRLDFLQSELDNVNKYLGTNMTVEAVQGKEEEADDDILEMDTDTDGSDEQVEA